MHGILRCLVLLGLMSVAACRLTNGTMSVNVATMDVVSPQHLIGKKIPRELLVVVDPSRVPDEYVIPQGEIVRTDIHRLQSFVARDLARVFGGYFDRVTVVAPGFAAPTGRYAVLDVSIDNLRVAVFKVAEATNGGRQAARVLGEMTWAAAIRLGEDDEYIFSFAGTSLGTYSITRGPEAQAAFRSAFEVALSDLMSSYVDKDVQNAIRARTPAE